MEGTRGVTDVQMEGRGLSALFLPAADPALPSSHGMATPSG